MGSAAPIPVTVTRPPPPAPDEAVTLLRGERLEAGREVRLGFVAVTEARAQLDVGVGPFHYTVTAGPGERVAVGPGALLVEAVEALARPVAVVRWDGEVMPGVSFGVPVDGRTHRLEVSARGYASRQVEVVADGPHTVDLPLSRGRSRPR